MRKELIKLRCAMKEFGIDAYMIPTTDFHGSEYVNDYFKVRAYVSGFTGSNGTLLVMQDKAMLWTDGRYFLQAEAELSGSGIDLMKMDMAGFPTIEEYAEKNLRGKFLGFDGRIVDAKTANELAKFCSIKTDLDLAEKIWTDRPKIKPSEIYRLDECVTGKSPEKKLEEVRSAMKKAGADYVLLTKLEETAWLFNLRGRDVAYTPVFFAFAIIGADFAKIYAMNNECPCKEAQVLPYYEIFDGLKQLQQGKIIIEESCASFALVNSVPKDVEIINMPTPVEMLKAIKNHTEIAATRNAHLKDGAAMAEFIYWLKKNINKIKITEISAADYLENCRMKQEGCYDLSFDTIAGYAEHGAIIHYSATRQTDRELKAEGLLLVDSGGQYEDGTTDITRTIVLGPITSEMKKHYTAVLKGHIQLAMAEFSKGTDGRALDKIARQPLKAEGLDFKHGTGHGVGHMLSVHEGPQRISPSAEAIAFKEGMITSNEPGYYLENAYGIRLENEILCKKKSDDKLYFETITFCPFEKEAILTEMLSEKEQKWLNDYHCSVYENISQRVSPEVARWLKAATSEI